MVWFGLLALSCAFMLWRKVPAGQPCLTPYCPSQVNQGNMPGIQSTFLAMDTEEGVEVVWNELLFTDKKAFKAHEVSQPSQWGLIPPPLRAPGRQHRSGTSVNCDSHIVLCSHLRGIVLSLGSSHKDSSTCPLYPQTSFPCDRGTASSPAQGSLALRGVLPHSRTCHLTHPFSACRRRSRPCLSSWCLWITPTS